MPNSLSDIYYGLLAQQMDEPKGLLASNYQNGLLGSPINPIAQRNRLADFGAKVPQARNLTLRDYADVFSGVANNTVMPFLPGAGDYIAARDSAELGGRAAESAKSGSYGDAALWGLQSLGAGLGALPFIPAMGGMTNKIADHELLRIKYNELLAEDKYAKFGLRVIPGEKVKRGDMLDHSFRWVDGNLTDEILPGVSTVEIEHGDVEKALRFLKKNGYYGKQIAIVKGDSAGYGEDEYELLLKNPEVAEVFDYDFRTKSIKTE